MSLLARARHVVDTGDSIGFDDSSMAISRNIDAYESIQNFERAYVGPGVHVLFDGRVADTNIVYIGKSTSEILMRVAAHKVDKAFDKVGVILPTRTAPVDIHNLEHFVMAEYLDRWGELPTFNTNHAHFNDAGSRFNWHAMGRRRQDSIFLGGTDTLKRSDKSPRTYARTVGELRSLFHRLFNANPTWTVDDTWEEVSRRLGGAYSAATLKQYSAVLHGNQIPNRLRR